MSQSTKDKSRPPARRAWWQWLIGIGMLGAAATFAALRGFPGLQSAPYLVQPREIRVPAEMKPSDVVPAAAAEYEGCNLLLVSFDTTRADRIGCYGLDRGRTFTLDKLAGQGVLFSQAAAPSPTTLPSHASLLTGLYPYHHGARANGLFRLDNEYLTLAEILAQHDYATGAFVSASVLEAQFGLAQGFRDYDDQMESTVDHPAHGTLEIAERKADATTERASEWLRAHADAPFFLWVHFYDPHYPYEPPAPYSENQRNPYDAEIAFADAQLGELVGLIDELGLTDKTLIVVAGDHGEGLGQHTEVLHSTLIYESTLHVPLIMRCGQRLGGGTHVSRLVSLVDVMPTVLTMLGIDIPESLDGADLTQPPAADEMVYSEAMQGLADHGWAALLGVRSGPLKYIFGPRDELYDLSQDPYEQKDVSESRPQDVAAMKQKLERFFGEDLYEAASAQPTHELDPAELAKLQSLGYLQGGGGDLTPAAERPHPLDMMPLLTKVQLAHGLEKTKGLEHSIRRLERIARRHPDLYAARLSLGSAYAKNDDFQLAEAEFEACMRLQPDRAEPALALGNVLLRQNEVEEGIELFREALSRDPNNFMVLKQLGRLLVRRGEYGDALELLTMAIETWPRDEAVPDLLTDAALVLGRWNDIIPVFEKLLETEPNLPMVRNGLSRLLVTDNRYDEGIAVLREAVELNPDRLDLVNNLAYLLVTCPDESIRRPGEAAITMERICFETDYQDPRFLHTLSMVYAAMLRLDEALLVAQKAHAISVASAKPEYATQAQAIGLSIERYKTLKQQGLSPTISIENPNEEKAAATEPTDAPEGTSVQPEEEPSHDDASQSTLDEDET